LRRFFVFTRFSKLQGSDARTMPSLKSIKTLKFNTAKNGKIREGHAEAAKKEKSLFSLFLRGKGKETEEEDETRKPFLFRCIKVFVWIGLRLCLMA